MRYPFDAEFMPNLTLNTAMPKYDHAWPCFEWSGFVRGMISNEKTPKLGHYATVETVDLGMPHPKSGSFTNNTDNSSDWELGRDNLEKADLQAGVSSWEALYHYVDTRKAEELFELVLSGYGDKSLIDSNWSPEEREAFQTSAFRLRRLLMDMGSLLWKKLRRGELVAFGHSNLAPLDAPRHEIRPERWEDLELDLEASSASGPGIEITQILIFPSQLVPPEVEDGAARAFSAAALRRWYRERVKTCRKSGRRPSREEDHRDANEDFEANVPKRAVEDLRRELAPRHWTQGGRPRGPKPG